MLDNHYPKMKIEGHLRGNSYLDVSIQQIYSEIGIPSHIVVNTLVLGLIGFRNFRRRKFRDYEKRQLSESASIRGCLSKILRMIGNKPLSFEETRNKYIQKLHKTQIEETVNCLMQ